jgi:hypothetical protein
MIESRVIELAIIEVIPWQLINPYKTNPTYPTTGRIMK